MVAVVKGRAALEPELEALGDSPALEVTRGSFGVEKTCSMGLIFSVRRSEARMAAESEGRGAVLEALIEDFRFARLAPFRVGVGVGCVASS